MSAATMTPAQVDRDLARLHGVIDAAGVKVRDAMDTLHRLAGHRPIPTRHGSRFAERDADAEAKVRARLQDQVHTVSLLNEDRTRRALAVLDEARATIAQAREAMEPLDAAWARDRWSRFFLVPDGHVHASLSCHTLRATTHLAWLPDLSGLTEADAVAAHGPLLCTHCFPSAPTEWTIGPVKADDPTTCPGSGRGPVSGTVTHRAYSAYGRCPECGTEAVVTSTFRLRKHKRPA